MTNPTSHRTRSQATRFGELLAVVVSLCCVGVIARHTHGLTKTDDAGAYQDLVRTAIRSMPRDLGEWSSIEVPIPTQAQQLLRPTAFLSRQYVNRATGESCVVTIIHCGDARSMLDHYPPNCYPGQGWVLESSVPTDVPTSFGIVHATDYTFSRGRFGTSNLATVTNAMLLPNGTSDRDMAGVERMMGSQSLRFFGVAQLQVFFDDAVAPERRRDIVREMVNAHAACILPIIRQPTIS